MNEFRVKLDGVEARLGRIPAADVARLLLMLERAAARTAAVVLGRPKTTTGRYQAVIEQAVRFRLLGIEEGSIVPVLELPRPSKDEGTLDLAVPGLGEAAIEALLATVCEPADPLIAQAVLDLADGMKVGERYESLTFVVAANGQPERRVRLDRAARDRLRTYVATAPPSSSREDDVVGVLVEADFEKRTARLRTPTEAGVEVSFSEDQADDIQAALRQNSTVRGDVVYDSATHVARSVRLTEIVRGVEQLALDPGAFWDAPSFAELAERQGAGHPAVPDELYDENATDMERDAFMAAIAELE